MGIARTEDGLRLALWGGMTFTIPFTATLLGTSSAAGRGLGEPHAALSRHEAEGRGAVWSTARTVDDLERQREEVLEYFALGATLPERATVIDVGAHCGLFAMEVAERSPGATLGLIEPIPLFQEAIVRNLRERFLSDRVSPETRLHRVGVGASESEQPIEFAYFTRLPTDTTCHVDDKYAEFAQVFRHHADTLRSEVTRALPGRLGRGLGELTYSVVADIPVGGWKKQLFDRAVGLERVSSRIVRLDTLLAHHPDRIDLVKIDCEGAELVALEGIDASQWSRIDQVVLEGNGGAEERRAIAELLSTRGLTDQREGVPTGAGEQGLSSYLLFARRPS